MLAWGDSDYEKEIGYKGGARTIHFSASFERDPRANLASFGHL